MRELFKLDLVERLPGDADGDGRVEFSDFTILANNFGRDGQFTFADGDFDGDGRVNFSDFLILNHNFQSVDAVDTAFAALGESIASGI